MDKKILIIDDEFGMIEELRDLLEDEGYKIDVAFDGIDGVEKFRRDRFNLVLLDIKMPKMDGVEANRKIKQINPMVPVIIITGSFEMKNAKQALQEGAKEMLRKPFDVEKLLGIVEKYIAKPTQNFTQK